MKIIKKELEFYSQYYFKIIEIINNAEGNARIIGGAVRDALLDKFPFDIDIATSLKPDQLISLFENHKIKTIPTGIKFGTITVIYEDESFQITTLRKDVECDGRHAEVEYTDDYEEDAKRRDFTINALSYCPIKSEIYDYFDGIEDLKNKKVIFIGDPNERICEDYLRILRFYRFTSSYGDEMDYKGGKACYDHRQMLLTLSKERIKSEIDKIILSEKSVYGLSMLDSQNIVSLIFKCTNYNLDLFKRIVTIANFYSDNEYFSYNNLVNIAYSTIFAYSLINNEVLGQDGLTVKDIINLKFSRADAIMVVKLIKIIHLKSEDYNDLHLLLTKIWLNNEIYLDYFILIAAITQDREEVYKFHLDHKAKTKPIFPINGNDLIKIGFKKDEIGVRLNYLKNIWIEYHFDINKKELIKRASDYEK